MDTLSALDTFVFIYFTDAILIHCNSIGWTDFLTWPYEVCDCIVWTGFGTHAAFLAFVRVYVGSVSCHAYSTELTCLLAGFHHTFSAIISYDIVGKWTVGTCGFNYLDYVIGTRMVTFCWTFAFCKADSLSCDFSFFIYTTAESCFRTGKHLVCQFVLFFFKPSCICELGNFIQDFMLDILYSSIIR